MMDSQFFSELFGRLVASNARKKPAEGLSPWRRTIVGIHEVPWVNKKRMGFLLGIWLGEWLRFGLVDWIIREHDVFFFWSSFCDLVHPPCFSSIYALLLLRFAIVAGFYTVLKKTCVRVKFWTPSPLEEYSTSLLFPSLFNSVSLFFQQKLKPQLFEDQFFPKASEVSEVQWHWAL